MGSNRQVGSLSRDSVGLIPGVFQALTHMGPAAGVASSLLVAFSFAGAATPLAVLLTLIVVLLVSAAVGSLATVFSSAGGLADYVEHTLGPKAGVFVGWLYAPLELLIAPIVFIFFGQFLTGTISSSFGIEIPWWIFVFIAAAFVCFVNIRGVKQSTVTGVVVGAAEIAIFAVLAIWMIRAPGAENTLAVFNPANSLSGGWSGVFKAVIFSILAFQGFETVAPLAEEVKNPRRTIPLTIVYSTIACGAFYLLCSYGAIVGWGFGNMDSFATAASPWSDLAQRFWGPAWLLVLFALVNSFIGNANAGTIAASRIIFSLGRSGRLPARFATIHPTHLTPSFAIYFQTAFSVVVAVALGLALGPVPAFTVLGAVLTVFAIIIYMITCVACIVYYAPKGNLTFTEVIVRLVCPALAALILAAPLYFQFIPWPDYPGNIGNLVAILFVVFALVATFIPSRKVTP